MSEDKFEDFLKNAAQSYNVPPVRAPRDEMWSAIQAKRSAGPRVVYGGASLRAPTVRRFGSRIWLGAAAAAVFLFAPGGGAGGGGGTSGPRAVGVGEPRNRKPPPTSPPGAGKGGARGE